MAVSKKLNLFVILLAVVLFSSSVFLDASAFVSPQSGAEGNSASLSSSKPVVEIAVANYAGMSATIAVGHKVIATPLVGYESLGQVGWDGTYFWIPNFGSGSFSLISESTNKVAFDIIGFQGPDGALYDPTNKVVYVTDFTADAVYPVNDSTLVVGNAIPVGVGPEFSAYSPATNEIYVGNGGNSSVSVIDPNNNSVVATIPIGNPGDVVRGLAYVPTTKDIYVLDETNAGVYQINTKNKVVQFGIFSGFPWNIAFNPKNGMLYMTTDTDIATENGLILVINPKTLVLSATISCGKKLCHIQSAPTGVAYDSQNGLMYVSDDNNNLLIPINGTKIVTPLIPTGGYPQGVTAGNPV